MYQKQQAPKAAEQDNDWGLKSLGFVGRFRLQFRYSGEFFRSRVEMLRCCAQPSWLSSIDLCRELGPTSQDVVAVGNKYPWANSSCGGVAVRRDKPLHSLCSAETQARFGVNLARHGDV